MNATNTPLAVVQEFNDLMEHMRVFMDRAGQPLNDLPVDQQHKDTLYRWNILCGRIQDSAIMDDGEEVPPRKKPRNAAANNSKSRLNPWKRIMDLAALPDLPVAVHEHLTKHGAAAAPYLNYRSAKHEVLQLSSEQTGDAFMSRYQWTAWRMGQQDQCGILILFGHLFWFDLVQIIRPQGNGRVGETMEEKLRGLLRDVVSDEHNGGLQLETAMDNISEWSLRGKKLNQLCRLYNPGLVFFLHKQFSSDFLDHKFTGSGTNFTTAMAHLEVLGLGSKLRDTEIGKLAVNIREWMIAPFKEAWAQRSSS